MKMLVLLTILIVTAPLPLAADTGLEALKDTYASETRKLGGQFEASAAKVVEAYGEALGRAVELLKKEGDPDRVLAAIAEKKRFMEEKTLPDASADGLPAPVVAAREDCGAALARAETARNARLAELTRRYAAALDRLMKKLTAEEKLDLALSVKQEKERAEFILADTASKLPKHTASRPARLPPRSPAAQPKTPPWRDITRTFSGGSRRHAGIVLRNQRTESRDSYSVPIEIEYVCMTDSTNIRLAYACRQLIFNWEVKRAELRIDGGPANRQHRRGAGGVPVGEFITIRQVVEKDKMSVFVDDELRAVWRADFSAIDSPIAVFSTHGATVTVKSVRIRDS